MAGHNGNITGLCAYPHEAMDNSTNHGTDVISCIYELIGNNLLDMNVEYTLSDWLIVIIEFSIMCTTE